MPLFSNQMIACAVHPRSVSKFNGVHSLDLYFSGSFGADFSEIHFIGLKGEFSEVSSG